MKVSIAIAAYFGNRHGVPNNYMDDCLYFVKTHMDSLEKIQKDLHKIYLVCTYDERSVNMDYINSYFYSLLENNEKIVILNRPNLGGSYAGWHNVLEFDSKESDYMVFIEDDYVVKEMGIERKKF